MSKEIKDDITEAVEEYSLDDELLELYDREKIIETDRIIAREEGHEEGYKEGHKEGLQEGKKEGFEEGSYEKANSIAKSLLENNVDISIICNSTGLSKEEVEKLK